MFYAPCEHKQFKLIKMTALYWISYLDSLRLDLSFYSNDNFCPHVSLYSSTDDKVYCPCYGLCQEERS